MGALTVKQLFDYLKKEIALGHKDYVLFVTDDEEANGYHALWYEGQCVCDMNAENRAYCEKYNHDLSMLKDTDKAIYLG